MAAQHRLSCCICLDGITDCWAALPCGHCFHAVCILQALESKRCCPTCRSGVPGGRNGPAITRLYLSTAGDTQEQDLALPEANDGSEPAPQDDETARAHDEGMVHTARIAALESKVARLTGDLVDLKHRYQSLRVDHRETTEQLEQVQLELDQLRTVLLQKCNRLDEALKDISRLENSQQNLQSSRKQLSMHNERLKAALSHLKVAITPDLVGETLASELQVMASTGHPPEGYFHRLLASRNTAYIQSKRERDEAYMKAAAAQAQLEAAETRATSLEAQLEQANEHLKSIYAVAGGAAETARPGDVENAKIGPSRGASHAPERVNGSTLHRNFTTQQTQPHRPVRPKAAHVGPRLSRLVKENRQREKMQHGRIARIYHSPEEPIWDAEGLSGVSWERGSSAMNAAGDNRHKRSLNQQESFENDDIVLLDAENTAEIAMGVANEVLAQYSHAQPSASERVEKSDEHELQDDHGHDDDDDDDELVILEDEYDIVDDSEVEDSDGDTENIPNLLQPGQAPAANACIPNPGTRPAKPRPTGISGARNDDAYLAADLPQAPCDHSIRDRNREVERSCGVGGLIAAGPSRISQKAAPGSTFIKKPDLATTGLVDDGSFIVKGPDGRGGITTVYRSGGSGSGIGLAAGGAGSRATGQTGARGRTQPTMKSKRRKNYQDEANELRITHFFG